MNDNDLATTLKDPFTALRMITPVAAVVARGRTLRRRRRSGAAALSVTAGLAIAAALFVPAHQAKPPVRATLAAWTVVKEPDGTVAVTIRDLNDPNGLLAKLRQYGVPVTFEVAMKSPADVRRCIAQAADPLLRQAVTVRDSTDPGVAALLLHPSVIPPGDTLGIYVEAYSPKGFASPGAAPKSGTIFVGPDGKRETFVIPITVSGDFAFEPVILNSAGDCV